MEVFFGMFMVLLWVIIVLMSRSITTFFHEMGHAIPALLFSEGPVEVYVGSYGDISKSIKINTGRLTIYFTFNFLDWNIGMCRHKSSGYFFAELITVVGGPLMSIIISVFLILYMSNNGATDAMASIFGIFIISAIWDFVVNIYPHEKPYQLHDGHQLFSDGMQLKKLITEASFPEEYFFAVKNMHEKKFSEAANSLEKILDNGLKKREIYCLLIECLEKDNKLEAAEKYYEEYHDQFEFRTIDYANLGAFFIKKGYYEEALNCLEKALHEDFQNPHILYNKGKALLEMGHTELALKDFNSAIHYQPDLTDAYSNRGWAKIKLGRLEEGFQDVQTAIKIGGDSAYNHFYLGRYFEKKWQHGEALAQYEKAKEMGIEYHGIDFDIAEMMRQVR